MSLNSLLSQGAAALGIGHTSSQASPPNASGYSVIYAFGDSLTDAGNVYTLSAGHVPSKPYVNGEFSNGPVWVQDLASQLGLPVPQPSVKGGTDFAYGGAETGTTPSHQANPIDLPSQLEQFKIQDPHPDPNGLYAVWAGSNDVIDAANAAMTDPAKANGDISAAVANIDSFVLGLASMGAKHFVIPEVPDIGKAPEFEAKGAQAAATASSVAAQFDNSLVASLGNLETTQGLKFDIVDTYHLLDSAVANPSAYGLTDVTDPVWTGNYTDPNSGVLRATTTAAQNQFLFWDNLHPTETGHAVVASAAASGLSAIA